MAKFLQNIAENLELTQFEPLAICDGGDTIAVPVLHAGRIIGGGEIDTMLECHVWRFDGDGKVAAFNHVLDLAIHERAYAQRD